MPFRTFLEDFRLLLLIRLLSLFLRLSAKKTKQFLQYFYAVTFFCFRLFNNEKMLSFGIQQRKLSTRSKLFVAVQAFCCSSLVYAVSTLSAVVSKILKFPIFFSKCVPVTILKGEQSQSLSITIINLKKEFLYCWSFYKADNEIE
jgi:hypothetical protein